MQFLNLNSKNYKILGILYGFLIIGLSSIPSRSMPDVSFLTMDKAIHFLEYMGFAILLYFGYKPTGKYIALLIFSGIVFGALDEMYQSFIPGRDVDIYDWVADVSGFVTGVIAGILLNYWNDKTRIN